jgi:hypothetical protein
LAITSMVGMLKLLERFGAAQFPSLRRAMDPRPS